MLKAVSFAAAVLAAVFLPPAARADDHGARVPLLPTYQKECGDCHVAYPPGLLPAASWQRLLNGLERHFGSNATLDPAVQGELLAWLASNAGTRKRTREAPPDDRISRAAWFVREHDELRPQVWKRPAVKSAARCEACHTHAAEGRYSEREIRVPR